MRESECPPQEAEACGGFSSNGLVSTATRKIGGLDGKRLHGVLQGSLVHNQERKSWYFLWRNGKDFGLHVAVFE